MLRTWVDVVPDGCSCAWRNRSDAGGWDLKRFDPLCPEHGDGKCWAFVRHALASVPCGETLAADGSCPGAAEHIG